MESKFIVCNLEENYGMVVFDSKEEFVENFRYMFEIDNFEDLVIEMEGEYEIFEVVGNFELKFLN
jgi:hypothetical protein